MSCNCTHSSVDSRACSVMPSGSRMVMSTRPPGCSATFSTSTRSANALITSSRRRASGDCSPAPRLPAHCPLSHAIWSHRRHEPGQGLKEIDEPEPTGSRSARTPARPKRYPSEALSKHTSGPRRGWKVHPRGCGAMPTTRLALRTNRRGPETPAVLSCRPNLRSCTHGRRMSKRGSGAHDRPRESRS
jgi:hypothetical protein